MASSSQVPARQRNGKGKKKLIMEKIEKRNNLLVTFSKRRSGLFKKASELCTLTGSKIGVIVFSPGNKVFSFGHPSIHNIINECFSDGAEIVRPRNNFVSMPMVDGRLIETHRDVTVAENNMWLSKVDMRMAVLKQWTTAIDAREKKEMVGQVKIEEMNAMELVEMKAKLNVLKESIMRMESYKAIPHQAATLHPVHENMGNLVLEPTVQPNLAPMGEPSLNPTGGVEFGYYNF